MKLSTRSPMIHIIVVYFFILLFAWVFLMEGAHSAPSKIGNGFVSLETPHAPTKAPTKVGNGDDGTDLEELKEIKDGKIFETRTLAAEKVKKLNLSAVPHLSLLLPEIEKTQLFIAKKDVVSKLESDSGKLHSSSSGLVYARTFPEAHASTRFFPIAMTLSEDQLVALHIHEALHRSLPHSVRENENVVSQITLAITSPGSSFDRVRTKVVSLIPEPQNTAPDTKVIVDDTEEYLDEIETSSSAPANSQMKVEADGKKKNQIKLDYSFVSFQQSEALAWNSFESMHVFGVGFSPAPYSGNKFSLFLKTSVLESEDDSFAGVTHVLGGYRVLSEPEQDLDIDLLLALTFSPLTDEEFSTSFIARNLTSFGVNIDKRFSKVYTDFQIFLTSASDQTQKIGNISYEHSFGTTFQFSAGSGVQLGNFRLGMQGHFRHMKPIKVSGGAFSTETGELNILSVGPEIAWEVGVFRLQTSGQFIVKSKSDQSFDLLGDPLGAGSGKGQVAATATFLF